MLATLASADAVTWVSIAVKVLAYATTLSAIGAVLVLACLRPLTEAGRGALRKTAALSAGAAAILTALRLPVQASFLMGGTWEGALDPRILDMVADSPLGTSTALRLSGLALVLMIFWRARTGQLLALLGALLASVSFALRGHALGEPQIALAVLVTLHILCLAFWLGALPPLARAARSDPPAQAGALAHAFSHLALWGVGLLVLCGGITLVLFDAATPSALSTPYGQMFAIKLVLFVGVLTVAAANKLSLTPALLASKPGAAIRLRRSIAAEAALMAGILVSTATLTTLSSPQQGHSPDAQAAFMALPIGSANHISGDA